MYDALLDQIKQEYYVNLLYYIVNIIYENSQAE